MYKLFKWLGLVLFILLFTACTDLNDRDNSLNQEESINEVKVKQQALNYIQALQNEDFERAYQMLSNVYIDAGITLADFISDFEDSELNLERYNAEVKYIRDRSPMEISESNKEEPFYLVSFHFDSKGETREDYAPFKESDVKWVEEDMWFHYEDGKWKFFATEEQDGVTWKPNVYRAALTNAMAWKNNDAQAMYFMSSDYFKQNGLTEDDIEDQLPLTEGVITSFVIHKLTDQSQFPKDNEIFSTPLFDDVVRVSGGFFEQDYQTNYYTEFEWYFHLEEGKWKYIADNLYDMHQSSSIRCFLGDSDLCKDIPTNNNEAEKSDPNSQHQIEAFMLDTMLANKENVMVFYYTPDCPHCIRTTPILMPLASELNVEVKQLNLKQYPDGWNKYNIDATPTLIFYKQGIEVSRIVGAQDYDTFRKWILDAINLENQDEMINENANVGDNSVQTEEITTDLMDGHFVRIQYQLVADSEPAKLELEKRSFQVKNIIIKELSQKTVGQVDDNEILQNELKDKINELLVEGQIKEVWITNKIVQ